MKAYHEAGHAVVADAEGFPVRSLSVREERDREGFCCYIVTGNLNGADPMSRYLIESAVRVSYAGEMAAVIATHRDETLKGELTFGAERDFASAGELVGRLLRTGDTEDMENETRLYHELLTYQVGAILSERWDLVKSIAHVLAPSGTLDASEIARLVVDWKGSLTTLPEDRYRPRTRRGRFH
jgi:hypothetical protein